MISNQVRAEELAGRHRQPIGARKPHAHREPAGNPARDPLLGGEPATAVRDSTAILRLRAAVFWT